VVKQVEIRKQIEFGNLFLIITWNGKANVKVQ